MILVLDASAAIRAVVDGANPLWRMPIDSAELIVAPDLIVAEICNGFWKYVRSGGMTWDRALAGMQTAIGLVNHLRHLESMADEVFELAAQTNHSVYDLFYLVLARRSDGRLLTADARLSKVAQSIGIECA